MALLFAVKPFIILSDHWNHVEAIKHGKHYCLEASREHVDIWILVWEQLDRHGGSSADSDVCWQKAHLQVADDMTEDQRHCILTNQEADKAANKGRELHGLPDGLIAEKTSLYAGVKEHARWLAKVSILAGKNS